jgi:hypothetical protein
VRRQPSSQELGFKRPPQDLALQFVPEGLPPPRPRLALQQLAAGAGRSGQAGVAFLLQPLGHPGGTGDGHPSATRATKAAAKQFFLEGCFTSLLVSPRTTDVRSATYVRHSAGSSHHGPGDEEGDSGSGGGGGGSARTSKRPRSRAATSTRGHSGTQNNQATRLSAVKVNVRMSRSADFHVVPAIRRVTFSGIHHVQQLDISEEERASKQDINAAIRCRISWLPKVAV